MMRRGAMNVVTYFDLNRLVSYVTEMYPGILIQAIKILTYYKIYYTREKFDYIDIGGNIQKKES